MGKAQKEATVNGPPSKGWWAEFWEFSRAILWAVGIAFLLRLFLVEAFKIPSGSMLPTLQVGDHIFVNKFKYGLMIPFTTKKFIQGVAPKAGEVVVFKFPHDTSTDYIKRVVATPGDTIEVIDGVVHVNGNSYEQESLHRSQVMEQNCRINEGEVIREKGPGFEHLLLDTGRGPKDFFGPVKVPPEQVFVMGDNRNHSSDSREWGFVPFGNIKGKALFVWLSLNGCASSQCEDKYGDELCGSRIRWGRLFNGVQ